MADAIAVSLAPLQAAIIARLQARFPNYSTVAFNRSTELASITTPAVLCELLSAEPLAAGSDGGSGRFACALRLLARIVIDDAAQAAAQVRDAALTVATDLHQWGHVPSVSSEPVTVIGIAPEPADNVPAGRLIWRVEWRVPVLLGESAWDEAGTAVQGFYSVVPAIGLAHLDDYRPLQAQP